jgi:hypothetical protein
MNTESLMQKIKRNHPRVTCVISSDGFKFICTTDESLLLGANQEDIVGYYNNRITKEQLDDDLRYFGAVITD